MPISSSRSTRLQLCGDDCSALPLADPRTVVAFKCLAGQTGCGTPNAGKCDAAPPVVLRHLTLSFGWHRLPHNRLVESSRTDGRAGIDAAMVKRLVATQFPLWGELPVTPVEVDGNDNRTYRLGQEMTVRLPTGEAYVAAVDKEHRWLSVLAPLLPVAIPISVAKGAPGEGYPFSWSIRRWLDGQTASRDRLNELSGLATSVAEFILALQHVDATGGPPAGAHTFYRGASLAHYDDETRRCLAMLDGRIDTKSAAAVWDAGMRALWHGPPVWFHGDIASGNLLVNDGRLAGVIDFGTSGVGDPACDLVIAWTLFLARQPEELPRCRSSGRRHLGTSPRLGAVESAYRPCPRNRHRPSGRRRQPPRHQRCRGRLRCRRLTIANVDRRSSTQRRPIQDQRSPSSDRIKSSPVLPERARPHAAFIAAAMTIRMRFGSWFSVAAPTPARVPSWCGLIGSG